MGLAGKREVAAAAVNLRAREKSCNGGRKPRFVLSQMRGEQRAALAPVPCATKPT